MKINRRGTTSLYVQLHDILRAEILAGKFSAGDKLPSERKLMEKYKLSRNTIRQAIRLLNKEGVIYTDHGTGTFATNYCNIIPSRIDTFVEHNDFLKLSGYIPSSEILSITNLEADEFLSEKLEIEINSPVFCIEKIFYANERPAIYSTDYIPGFYDSNDRIIQEYDQCEEFMQFLEAFRGFPVEFGMSDLMPVSVDEIIADKLKIPLGQPILMLTEIFLDPLQTTRIGLGVNYYCNFIQFSLLRRRSDLP